MRAHALGRPSSISVLTTLHCLLLVPPAAANFSRHCSILLELQGVMIVIANASMERRMEAGTKPSFQLGTLGRKRGADHENGMHQRFRESG